MAKVNLGCTATGVFYCLELEEITLGRFDGGWIKIHRKLDSGDMGDDAKLMGFWVRLLMWANVKDSKVKSRRGFQQIVVKRGQILTSREELKASFKNVSTQNVRTYLAYLSKTEKINLQSNHHGTLITICNYESYQETQQAGNTQSNHQPTISQPSSNHHPTISQPRSEERKKERRKEGENERKKEFDSTHREVLRLKEEELRFNTLPGQSSSDDEAECGDTPPKPKKTPKWQPDDQDLRLGMEWHTFSVEQMPWTKPPKNWSPELFAQQIAEVRHKVRLNGEGISAAGMQQIFKVVSETPIYRENCMTPIKLLNKWKNGRPIDKILMGLKTGTTKLERMAQVAAEWAAES